MSQTPLPQSLAALPARFAPRQLLRRTYWPLWLGLALGVTALWMTWTATTTYEALRICRDYEYGCSYSGTRWDSSSFGGFGAGNWSLPLLGGLGAVLAWAAARRDLPRPAWFARVPGLAVAILVGIAAINVPEAIALDEWVTEKPTYGLIQTYDPAGGPFLMLLAAWPLWIGIRRVRRMLDAPASQAAPMAATAGPAVTTAG